MAKVSYTTFDEYFALCEPAYQEALEQIRALVHEAVPEAKEKISWGLPTFYQYKSLIQFGACKGYIGFYPGPEGVTHFQERLTAYTTTKAAIHFPLNQPIPYDFIREIVLYMAQLDRLEAQAKKKQQKSGKGGAKR